MPRTDVATGPVGEVPEPEHTARRPEWLCRDCGQPWPCPARKTMLRAEFQDHPVAVVLHLAACYEEATTHLTTLPPDAIYSRMFGWLRGR